MSQTAEPTEPEEEITKKVDIVCYLNAPDDETRRQFAQRVGGETDYFRTKTRERTYHDYYLRTNNFEKELDEDEYEALKDTDLGDAKVVHETETEESVDHIHRPITPLRDLYQQMFDEIVAEFDELPFGWETKAFGAGIRDPDGDASVRFHTNFDRLPMLKHQSEISEDDMYEDEDEDYLTFKLKVKSYNVTKEQLEWIDENITGQLMTMLARHEWVDKVRTYDCEMQTKEKGVCWNI